MRDEVRVLTVGTDVDLGTKSVAWTDDYNVKDFDWVFLDFHSLDKSVGDSTISDSIEGMMNIPDEDDIFKSIANGNNFIVFLPERRTIPKTDRTSISLYNLTPVGLNLVEESGSSIDYDTINPNWTWYFDSNFDWNIRIDRKEPAVFELFGRRFVYEFTTIVQNNSSELLATDILFHEITEPEVSTHQPEMNQLPGKLSFIPVIKNWSPNELIREILDSFTDMDTRIKTDQSPEWVNDWRLPEEDGLVRELEDLRIKKKEIESKIKEKEGELDEYEEYKALLWGNEGELEILVPTVFREMDFEVEGEVPHGRDGMIRLDDLNIVLEITGTKNSISDKKCRQLSTWVDEAEIDELDRDHTGILVANPDRETNPPNRTENDYLPPHLQNFLSKRGYKVLLTHNLFELYSEFRKGDLSNEDIEEMLRSDSLFVYGS
ncbi:hypothetical protein [Natronorubrum texcoconense]|uniref:Uncharacterized protein n=1 Tax=Natronorubrum texcoconense TaxID=1095776 RepID=A0A1G9E2L5_9EURY|nr:hypothetical protein [Natronorubrum texcoconense]SDK70344.1 hypothetical protein SAMN04515672_3732 [Natronorubrum texcoconense]